MNEPRNIRQILMLTAYEDTLINNFWHAEHFPSRSEALRHLIMQGLGSVGVLDDAEREPAEDLPAPHIPEPAECGRPVLGEILLPYLRKEGRRSYAVNDVAQAVFGDTAQQPGRIAVVRNLFKAIGWKPVTVRDGTTATSTFHAPDDAQ